jgi:hypothetical protein
MNTEKVNYGVPVYVRFGQGKKATKEKGIILDFADSAEGNYYWTKIELIKENPLSPGQILRQVHPHPIQSYRLTQRTPDEDELIQGMQETLKEALPDLPDTEARIIAAIAIEHW